MTTDHAVTRIWRGETDQPRVIRVSGAGSFDPDGDSLYYFWRLLRGDPALVTIAPVDDSHAVVDVTIQHHPEQTHFVNGHDRKTSLVVIGLFVHDGRWLSAPSFVTSYSVNDTPPAPSSNNLD